MSKDKQNIEQTEDVVEAVTAVEQETNSSKQEFVENSEKETAPQADKEDTKVEQKAEEKTVVVQKSGGKGIALLALLVAIAVGGAGHYLANQKFTDVEQQIAKLAGQQPVSSPQIEIPNFDAEKAQIAELGSSYQKALERIGQLEQEQSNYLNQINGLKTQLQKVSGVPQSESVVWKLSDADFLLNNALRKLVLDNDIDTAKSLLSEADSVLSQVSNTDVANVRSAIKSDLSQLANVNNVDQNSLMQRLTALANRLDDLPMIANEAIEDTVMESGEVSDSIEDWQKNIEKSASSFLDHFIRVSDRNKADEKAFVAPNQEVYLRENIRLRLQIAILAIPRQQNELYKQSLDAVGTWIRSYFETQNESVKSFLKELDDLSEQSIYIDAPDRLKSIELLEHLLNKAPQTVEKIEIKAEKELAQPATETKEEPVPQQPVQPQTEQPSSVAQ
ncbi:uroporphyrinogen-III C-methyltransferase [Actinobacillus pleuropneumoniae]|uniref:uroporphyrinogen-III C-methyltransferase n=1 Tax=Actinobacillus pleuropneumoniae TaxID=715 RepID=UPI0001E49DCB|nr:uroporphyrinogen-III C-methyltransferase [Actinobacillus pleuropneumoniae]EFM96333.1 Uroporphyrin-III C-methyltransferase [Actinobacillus pleuropneumoniae serovar 10 str. D13039]MCL7725842.1 uroporphyrinogen-III C-methyltransferase [Actinobacillus pleuropneumoniae]MCL7738824.1 uroporphyrinogen-III C-methyltransferase [Actinobacillus pleuropneumoniae]UKH32884.1 HemX protein [Actinobacillus pleuropneumoniae serovar 10 str. D13039]